ncbi:pilus assembly protein [Nitrosomonas sp. PY1]|nr:pilus assembly protein [Nitrosomonas sp. PY1]
MTVQNKTDKPSIIQLNVVSWQQTMGEDYYLPTREILATPPIFTIPPGSSQIVRLGLQRQPENIQELAYRLFLQEVPQSSAREGEINIILRFGIPIFVAPDDNDAHPLVEWRAVLVSPKKIRLEAINSGNAHIQITNLTISEKEFSSSAIYQKGMFYILPKQKRHWYLSLEKSWPLGTRLKITAQTNTNQLDNEAILVDY